MERMGANDGAYIAAANAGSNNTFWGQDTAFWLPNQIHDVYDRAYRSGRDWGVHHIFA